MVSSAIRYIFVRCVGGGVSKYLIHIFFLIQVLYAPNRLVEFVVMLSVILSCTKLQKGTTIKLHQSSSHLKTSENIYMENVQNSNSIPSNIERDHYIQPPDLYSNKNSTTFKPLSKYQYHISKSYLV